MEKVDNNDIKNNNIKYNAFDLTNLVLYLKSKTNIKSIAIQANKEDLSYMSGIKSELKEKFPEKFFYILGESGYGDCCVDVITAKHLSPELIVRIGDSCLTNPEDISTFYVFKKISLRKEFYNKLFSGIALSIAKNEENKETKETNVLLLYFPDIEEDLVNYMTNNKDLIHEIEKKYNINFKIPLETNQDKSQINKATSLIIFNRVYTDYCNNKEINKSDKIVLLHSSLRDYYEVLKYQLALNNMNKNSFMTDYTQYIEEKDSNKSENKDNIELNDTLIIEDISQLNINKLLIKKYNLSVKAKECNTFGILVGNLNLNEINYIINTLKVILRRNNKKYYVFLLGKITNEKLSNYIEYIDCFILISCLNTSFQDKKACDKPIVTPIDILHAFDVKEWSVDYSFDPRNIKFYVEKEGIENKNIDKNSISNKDGNEDTSNSELANAKYNIQSEAIALLEKDENKALACIFSSQILDHYNERKFKGLEMLKGSERNNKIHIGKKGLPIHYEDINESEL